jgi:hypothetical protein
MKRLEFEAVPITLGAHRIILLPREISSQLPSRGMVHAQADILDTSLEVALEPDGQGSHWFFSPKSLIKAETSPAVLTISLLPTPRGQWPEPDVPRDFDEAIVQDQETHPLWLRITTAARWDWLRWIRSTSNPKTRAKRIMETRDKLIDGKRRPCCFNRNLCTAPEVSKSGILLLP